MINLSNYEEYFLLYIDNELSKEQCEVVRKFVLEHPHLAAELDLFQEAKLLSADAVVFNDKSSLYKPADCSININNYEEYFLLHTDRELSANQEEEVEQFVLQHPQLQEEFLLLQKSKLVPETVECPDKHSLYKQSGRRVIPLYIRQIAVAAAVAGLVLLIGGILVNKDNSQMQVAVNTPQSQPVKKNTTSEKTNGIVLPKEKNTEAVVARNEPKQPVQTTVKKANKIVDKAPALPDSQEGSNNKPVIAKINILPEAQQTVPAPEEVIVASNTEPTHQQTTVLKPLEEIEEKESESTVVYASNQYTLAQPALYKELDTEEEDDQTLYVGSLQLNKAKVNGLFKKATHLLGGKAKN